MINQERLRRQRLWKELLSRGGPRNVAPRIIREIGIYGGAQGIWVDKKNTGDLTIDGHGITVGLLHRGDVYPDDLTETRIWYHYPETQRPRSRDRS